MPPLTGRGKNSDRNLNVSWFSFQCLIWQGCDLNLGIDRFLSYLCSGWSIQQITVWLLIAVMTRSSLTSKLKIGRCIKHVFIWGAVRDPKEWKNHYEDEQSGRIQVEIWSQAVAPKVWPDKNRLSSDADYCRDGKGWGGGSEGDRCGRWNFCLSSIWWLLSWW